MSNFAGTTIIDVIVCQKLGPCPLFSVDRHSLNNVLGDCYTFNIEKGGGGTFQIEGRGDLSNREFKKFQNFYTNYVDDCSSETTSPKGLLKTSSNKFKQVYSTKSLFKIFQHFYLTLQVPLCCLVREQIFYTTSTKSRSN